MVTKLRNEITNFCQRLDESLFEAWEHYMLSIDLCPNHKMLPVTQIDTFYNRLTLRHRDTIDSVAGGTFMKRRPEECYNPIKNMTAHHNDWDTPAQRSKSSSSITSFSNPKIVALKAEMAKNNKNLIKVLQVNQQVKAVTPNCETYGGPHSYNDCPATVGQTQNVYAVGAYQGGNSYQYQGTLLSNTITNPKEDLKGIITRSGTAYQGPMIPTTSSSLPKVVERETEVTKDTVHPTNNGSTKDVQPLVVQIETHVLNSKPVVSPIIKPVVAPVNFVVVDFDADPRVPLILGRFFPKTGKALIDVYEGELTLHVGKEAIIFNLDQTSRYSANYNDMTANRIDVIDMACEEYSQEVLSFSDVIAFGNPTPYYDPIVSTSSPTLTPFGDSDFLLEEVDAFLALEDDATSPENDKSSIDEPPEVELKDLPPHLEYAFLVGDDKLAIINAKDLSVEEKATLIKVLKSHKQAIAWKLLDIKGINLEFCTHKILMDDDFKPTVQHQRRASPKIHKVIKKEVLKLLDAGLIYPISDSPWVSPVHCVPKKGGFTVVENEENELIPTRLVMGWRVCIDYREESLQGQRGIVLGHKISKNGIEVDKAKVDVITKLPHPTTIKGIRSFLGHVVFYRRFIQDFLKIARPMTPLLEKDTPFFFSKECVEAFQTLKKKLTEAPILVAPNWDLPFELMCNASDFAIGNVIPTKEQILQGCEALLLGRTLLVQNLYGSSHPAEFLDFEDLCWGFCPSITGSSLPQLHLGIKYPNLID
uniref:Reverse transcriptase domain-containing protein n=1 Tax=Tanacetum cinerariifolium TaxID=118510 RepID=A0A699GHL7_TANCI|nr:reverse transcriptase domain-containing protein [Tanacetum cinerariifolium]